MSDEIILKIKVDLDGISREAIISFITEILYDTEFVFEVEEIEQK